MTRYFEYATDAIEYLKAKDKKLGAAIDAVGVVRREMDEDDLFTAIVHPVSFNISFLLFPFFSILKALLLSEPKIKYKSLISILFLSIIL